MSASISGSISWPEAFAILRGFLPDCNQLVPDAILEAARIAGFQAELRQLPDWESLTDFEIIRLILPARENPAERLVFVSDVCFSKKIEPFLITIGQLEDFVSDHLSTYHECAVNGDLVLLLLERKQIVLFHHEGYYATITIDRP